MSGRVEITGAAPPCADCLAPKKLYWDGGRGYVCGDCWREKHGVAPPRDTRNGDPQHWVPANFKYGTSLRPKRGFATAEEAVRFAQDNGTLDVAVYQCGTCGQYHFANVTKPGRRADASQKGVSNEHV